MDGKKYYDIKSLKSIPIPAVLARFGIEVNHAGFFAIRNERTPSAKYYRNTNTYCDFGMHNDGGDVLKLYAVLAGLDMRDAIEKMAIDFGVLPEEYNHDEIQLSDSQWQLIGLYGDMASKNMTFERNVLHMVISRILTALAEDMHYSETLIECRIGDYNTLTKDKFVTSEGYMQIQSALTGSNDSKGSKDRNELILSKDVKVGAILQPATAACTSHLTTPPQLHTEATLLTAMINASNSVDDENEAEVLKESGIGTKATRAGIIKNLFDYGFVEYDGNGKVKHIIPTEKGQEIIAHVEPDLKSAALTAQMQLMLAEVAEGALSEAECMVHITSYIQQLFLKIRSREQWSYQKQYTQESIGRCPYCGGNVLMGQYGMYCEKYKECHFTVSFEKNFAARCAGKALTKTQMKALLDKGLTMTLKSKSGTKYKKIFRINPVWSEQYKSVQIDSDFLK